MKVLVLTNMYPSAGRPSYGIFVRDQVIDLRSLGVDISVLFVDGRQSRAEYLRGYTAVRRTLRATGAEIVHAHYGLTGAIGATQSLAPSITTFYGSDCSGASRWQKAVSWFVARCSWPIFVSAQLAHALGLPDAVVIPTAVDMDVFRPEDRADARRALGWKPEGLYALFPGSRTNWVKGADLFDQALECARLMGYKIMGRSLERLPRSDVVLALNAANVTLMTSRFEGSPVIVKESLACQTPVVSVPVGDVEYVLRGLPGCSVVRRDPTQLAESLISAIESGRPSVLRASVAHLSRLNIAKLVMEQYERTIDTNLVS